jgi:hypothetical protein
MNQPRELPRIKTNIVMLRMAAQLTKHTKSAKFYEDTACLMEGMEGAYEQLYQAAKIAVQSGDMAPLRAYMAKIEAAWKLPMFTQTSGAA